MDGGTDYWMMQMALRWRPPHIDELRLETA